MKPKLGAFISAQTNSVNIDLDLLRHSRAARISKRLVQASLVINALAPALVICLTAASVMAQGPTGGTIFGGNDQTLGNGVRELIKWGRNLLFLLGVGGIAWAAVNYM